MNCPTDYVKRSRLAFEQLEAFLCDDDFYTLDLTNATIVFTPKPLLKRTPRKNMQDLKDYWEPKIVVIAEGISFE